MTMPHSAPEDLTSTAPSVTEALGQMVWLFTQSPMHRELALKDLEWSVLPALILGQYRIFRFGPLPGLDAEAARSLAPAGLNKLAIERLPLGVALWARLSEEAEARLDRGEQLSAEEWESGDRVWLMELVAPFSTLENKLSHAMMLDLIQGPFANTPFSLHRIDPATGRREKVRMTMHVDSSNSSRNTAHA
jgi:cytolysin-activating lysine-acyltransferase